MTPSKLKTGMVVEYRNGWLRLVVGNDLYDENGNYEINLDKYCVNLTRDFKYSHDRDIVAVYNDFDKSKCLWKRKEIILTEDEKSILKNINKEYKYIARDQDNRLYLYCYKPKKEKKRWLSNGGTYVRLVCDSLFKFIDFKDEEPYLISFLLKGKEQC